MPFIHSVTDYSPRKIKKRKQLRLLRNRRVLKRKIHSIETKKTKELQKKKHYSKTAIIKKLQEPPRFSLSSSSTTSEQHRAVVEDCRPDDYSSFVQDLLHSIEGDSTNTCEQQDDNTTGTCPFPIVCWEEEDEDDDQSLKRRPKGSTLGGDILRPIDSSNVQNDYCPHKVFDQHNHHSSSSLDDQHMKKNTANTNANAFPNNRYGSLKRSHKITSQLNLLTVGQNALECKNNSTSYFPNACWF